MWIEGGTEASQECHKQKAIGGVIAMLICRDKSDDGIGDEKDGEDDDRLKSARDTSY